MNYVICCQSIVGVILPGFLTTAILIGVFWDRVGVAVTPLARELPVFALVVTVTVAVVLGMLLGLIARSVEPALQWIMQSPSLDSTTTENALLESSALREHLEITLLRRWQQESLRHALYLTAHDLAQRERSQLGFYFATRALYRNMLVASVLAMACLLRSPLLLCGVLFLLWLSFLLLATPLEPQENRSTLAAVRASFCLLAGCLFLVGTPAGWPWTLEVFNLGLASLSLSVLLSGFQYRRTSVLLIETVLAEGAVHYAPLVVPATLKDSPLPLKASVDRRELQPSPLVLTDQSSRN